MAQAMALALELVIPAGKLIIMSSFDGREEFDMRLGCIKAVNMIFAHPPYFSDQTDCLRRTQMAIDAGTFGFEKVISHRFALDDINTAFEVLNDRPSEYLKGIVVP